MAVYSVNNSNDRFTLRLTVTEGDYSITDNSSPVTYKLELIANTSYHFSQYSIGSMVVLDGVTVHNQARTASKQYSISGYGTLLLGEGKKTIVHNTDGSKKIPLSFSIDMGTADYTPGPLSKSSTMTLTTIPRKATVTSSSDFTDEQDPEVYFSNPGKFNVAPYFNVYDQAGERVYNLTRPKKQYTSPYSFELTDDERKALRKATNLATSYKVNIGINTYNGEEYIDYHSKSYTFSIVNANPIFTEDNVSYVDINPDTFALTESEGQDIVSLVSLVKVTCSAAQGNKEATISRYDFSLGSAYKSIASSQGATAELGAVASNKDLVLSVTVYDSRGNYTTVQKTVTILPYSEPRLSGHKSYTYIMCDRCDESGSFSRSGKNLKVAVQGQWSALPNNKNAGKLEVMYTTSNENSKWYTLTTDVTAGSSSDLYISKGDFNGIVNGVTLDVTKSYVVTVRCIDSLEKNSSISFKIPTQAVDFHLKKGAAFGEYVTEKSTLKLSDQWTAHGLYGLGKCKQIPENADANDLREFRVWGISSADVCKTIKNLPETESIGLFVVYSSDGTGRTASTETEFCNISQRFISFTTDKEYIRTIRQSPGTETWRSSVWSEK